MSKNLDANAQSGGRVRRNWANINKGGATALVGTSPPIVVNGSNQIALQLATTGGLTVSGATLALLLDTNPGLALSASGLKVLLNGTSLTLGASGLSLTGAMTTKGDLHTFSTTPIRMGVGANDAFLIADSAQTTGLKWGTSIGNITITGTASVGTLSITTIATNGTFLAGAVGGPPTVPSFRAIAANDLPGLLNDTSFGNITISNNITVAGTAKFTNTVPIFPNQSNATVFSGPATGAAAAPSFRSLVSTDLPGGNWIGNTNGESTLAAPFTLSTNATYSNTGLTVALPAAGTYRVEGQIRASMGTSMTTAFVTAKLFNSTAAADVANSTVLVAILPTPQATAYLGSTVTVAGATTIALFAQLTFTGVLAPTQVQSDSNGWTKLAFTRIA